MKIINILVGILTTVAMPMLPVAQSAAQGNAKFYQVTGDQKFQFTYWQSAGEPKGVVHPVTPRTFYLETRRLGLIPDDISFNTFLKIPVSQLQAITESGQKEIITAINNQGQVKTVNRENLSAQPEPMSGNFNVPSANQAGADPGDKIELPIVATAPPIEQNGYEVTNTAEAGVARYYEMGREMPWIIKVMLMPETLYSYDNGNGQEEAEKAQVVEKTQKVKYFVSDPYTHKVFQDFTRVPAEASVQGAASNEEENELTDKKSRLLILLNELMVTCRSDEIREKYGRVFPAIEGKLYGTSDAELNEILAALVNMKDDFLSAYKARTNQDEVSKIFGELEAMAFGK